MPGHAELPHFKYHPNLYELDILERFEGACECCGEAGDIFYQGMYTTEDVDYICPWCISSGRAAEMFHGHFNADSPRIDNPEAVDELLHRTPGYVSWQGEVWMACCGDYCAYLGPVGTAELEEIGIADDLFEADGSLDGWEGARQDMVKNGWFTGHLFRCLHCGRYHLRADVS